MWSLVLGDPTQPLAAANPMSASRPKLWAGPGCCPSFCALLPLMAQPPALIIHASHCLCTQVLVGRSNTQNDTLSMRVAAPQDIWFHVRGRPGSHVVLRVPKSGGGGSGGGGSGKGKGDKDKSKGGKASGAGAGAGGESSACSTCPPLAPAHAHFELTAQQRTLWHVERGLPSCSTT